MIKAMKQAVDYLRLARDYGIALGVGNTSIADAISDLLAAIAEAEKAKPVALGSAAVGDSVEAAGQAMTKIAKCRHCGNERYHIRMVCAGYSQRLFIVECGDCHSQIIPVVTEYFEQGEPMYDKCREAWNAANP